MDFDIPSTIQGHLRMNHTFTVTLYQGKNNKLSKRKFKKEEKKKEKKQPTILDTTQSTANITSISIYISLIYT